jgi:hypothetical protein
MRLEIAVKKICLTTDTTEEVTETEVKVKPRLAPMAMDEEGISVLR